MGEGRDGWQSLRMAQHYNVMLQTDSGLTHGSMVWIDQMHLHVLCPERLPLTRGLRIRIDLGALGEPVDLQITVGELAVGKTQQAGRGWLHQARWIALSLDQGDRLTGMLPRINTKLALHSVLSSVSRSRGSTVSHVRGADSTSGQHRRGSGNSTMHSVLDSESSSRSRSQSSSRRRSRASSSTSSRQGRRGSMPAMLAPGNPVNVLVQADDTRLLARALRLGPGSLRLAVKLPRETEAVTALTLVFRLPDDSFLQLPATVLRVAGRRWLLEADDVPGTDLALLRKLLPQG